MNSDEPRFAGTVASRPAWHRRWRHSLGARLTLLFLLFALLLSLVFMVGMQSALRYGWQDYARPLVADYLDTLAAQIGSPPDVAKARALTERLPLRIRIDGPVVNWSSHPDERHRGWRDRYDDRPTELRGNPWRPSRMTADGHRITFGFANLPRDDSPEDRPRLIGWATLAAMLLLTALAYRTVRRLLRPLDDIRAGAIRFGQGDFSQPIEPRRRDELGELALQINGMADGLQQRLDAKRELLLAISHELRSPLTRARLNAELVAESSARNALLHDLGEMRDLIVDLLESERLAGGGHAALNTEATDLNALVAETLASQFADSVAAHAIRTELAPALPTLPLDRTRMRLLLRNLIDNALRHSRMDHHDEHAALPAVVVATAPHTADDGQHWIRLSVRDHGPGVTDAQLPHLSVAFYRTDSARQRSTGGVGLGLYLCRLVTQAHGGRFTARNARPGLEIEVLLPLPAA
ncbi:MAG TPA: HAMP domain-containing sensor histidine kinase [Burkholderiaceae bacterium]|nr:HAMP domain-containing sensor histidine kinase [Burkholderiaceae bacterium]